MSGVDLDRLASLRDDIGAEDFADVVLLFFAEIGDKLEQMHKDSATLTADDFHFLRGSAANLGFTAMVAACERAEADCAIGRTPDLAAVSDCYNSALFETRAQVPELTAA